MDNKPTPSEIVIMASGAFALIFSFFDYIGDVNAWSRGLFPLATYVAIIGVLMATQVALARFADVKMPERVLTFTWTQLHLAFGFFATLISIGFLLVDFGGASRAIGFWVMLLASIGLLVGAVLRMNEVGGTAPPAT